MKAISAILFACCFALTALGQRLTLNGALMTDAKTPVPATRISVHGIENATDSKGQFKIVLSGDFSEGERVIIKVVKPGWVINYPLDGEWNLPNVRLQNIQTLDVIIVPKGSKALWTHARIEKQIAKLSDEIARLKKEGDTPRPIDFSFYLREWADQSGFTPEQVKAAFDDWAKAVEKSDDYRTLGLRAFYQNNFPLAAENFVKAAQKDEGQIKSIQEQLDRKILSAYQNRKDAGNSFKNSYRFREALEQYNFAKLHLVELISKDKHQFEQFEIEVLIGNAKYQLGISVEGEEGNRRLLEAIASYKQALWHINREQSPQDWAMTQNNIGAALSSQGQRTAGEEGMRSLGEAVSAFRNALVHTREQLPQDWAAAQNNLGNALRSQGRRTAGKEGAKLLAEAGAAYRNALQVHTRDQLPQAWVITQNNLGDVYFLLREWSKAAECYANVFTLYPTYEKEGYQRLSGIYHERLFEYELAFKLHQRWLIKFPDDLSVMADFAETHFTTGRFAECHSRISALLVNPDVEAPTKIALRLIEIANLFALGQDAEVSAKLDLLIEAVAAQPEDFKITWTFNGTLHFINQSEKLAGRRDWLTLLLSASEGANREAAIKTLREAKAGFKP